jgi:hypothetical protein
MPKPCGECGICCKLLYIESTESYPGDWCKYFSPDVGCTIHNTKDYPEECREFQCIWSLHENELPEFYPKRALFMIHAAKMNEGINEGTGINSVAVIFTPTVKRLEMPDKKLKNMQKAINACPDAAFMCNINTDKKEQVLTAMNRKADILLKEARKKK